jgi:predicted RNase H-like HicB family nuclease
MKTFYAIVHKDTDSAFGVQFPDAPGCFSAADDLADVLPNAAEALSLYFDDVPPPEPSDLKAVRAAAAAALHAGAFIVAVPLIERDSRVVRANISLDKGTLDAIDAAATARGLTRSAFLAEAARREIKGRH